MSEDIYAKPDLTKKVRFQTGGKANGNADVSETTDTMNIYDNYVPEGRTPPGPQDSTTEDKQTVPAASVIVPSGGKNPLRHALWLLALLCLLFLAVVISLVVLLIQDKSQISNLTRANDELWTSHGQMESHIDNLTMKTTGLERENDLLKVIERNLTKERDELQKQIECSCCPENWMRIGNSCYFLSNSMTTWTQSKEICQSQNADLVIISSRQEQALVSTLCNMCWIGLRKDQRDRWIWVDGSEATIMNWEQNQPSNSGGNEDCVQILSNGRWNDIACNKDLYFICEKVLK